MKYLICRDVYEDYDDSIIYISTEETTEKNDLVVYKDSKLPKCSYKNGTYTFAGWALTENGPVVISDNGTFLYDADLVGLMFMPHTALG